MADQVAKIYYSGSQWDHWNRHYHFNFKNDFHWNTTTTKVLSFFRNSGLSWILSYEVLSTNGRPRSLEEQCLLQLKVNLEDVQIKHLRNRIPETLHKKLLNIVPN